MHCISGYSRLGISHVRVARRSLRARGLASPQGTRKVASDANTVVMANSIERALSARRLHRHQHDETAQGRPRVLPN
jgi:hypothetical protein